MDFGALDLRLLRLVRAVAEEGTLTAAAARLALSQSALSHQLRAAEDRLGTAVFERRGRALVRTPVGDRLLAAAHAVLGEVERAQSDVAALASGRAGTLRVTAECYTTYHWLPRVLTAYAETYPDVDVVLATEATERPDLAITDRTVDVAVLTLADEVGEGTTLVRLFEDEVVAVVAADHAWAGQPCVDLAAFGSEHVFVYQSHPDRDRVLALAAAAGTVPRRVTPVTHSTEGIVAMVRAGLGVTTMARWAAAPYLEGGGLAAVRIGAHGFHRTWHAAVRDEARPAYVDGFVDTLLSTMTDATPDGSRHHEA